MRATLHGIESEAQARRALEEVERLIADAASGGVRLDPWVSDLAEELRAVIPQMDAKDVRIVAERIARDPRQSLAAQSGLRGETLRALKP
jgi:hypothetical protein